MLPYKVIRLSTYIPGSLGQNINLGFIAECFWTAFLDSFTFGKNNLVFHYANVLKTKKIMHVSSNLPFTFLGYNGFIYLDLGLFFHFSLLILRQTGIIVQQPFSSLSTGL